MPPRRPLPTKKPTKQEAEEEDQYAEQDTANKEEGGKVKEAYDYNETEPVVQATPAEILTAHQPDQPSERPVEVHLGPVQERYLCPFNVKKPQHPIPYTVVSSKKGWEPTMV